MLQVRAKNRSRSAWIFDAIAWTRYHSRKLSRPGLERHPAAFKKKRWMRTVRRHMNKQEILSEIKRTAAENNGKAPGSQRFAAVTGIRKSDWFPKLWLRWGDALSEAGCPPNAYSSAYDSSILIARHIELIREFGHFPIEGELIIKKNADNDFPSPRSFYQLGSKQERAQKIIDYCQGQSEYDDIISCCSIVARNARKKFQSNRCGF